MQTEGVFAFINAAVWVFDSYCSVSFSFFFLSVGQLTLFLLNMDAHADTSQHPLPCFYFFIFYFLLLCSISNHPKPQAALSIPLHWNGPVAMATPYSRILFLFQTWNMDKLAMMSLRQKAEILITMASKAVSRSCVFVFAYLGKKSEDLFFFSAAQDGR